MNSRLDEIIAYRTDGSRVEFAKLVGWSKQYLAKLLRGESWGIAPVRRIVEALPEVDARWLITGEGNMLKKERGSRSLPERRQQRIA